MKLKNIVLGAALIGILGSAPVFADDDLATTSQPQVDNFAEVVPGKLYRGGRPSDQDMQMLDHIGVRTDIDLQGGDYIKFLNLNDFFEQGETPEAIDHEHSVANALGITFFNTPLKSFDDVSHSRDKLIDAMLDVMDDPSFQPVFVHCEHGRDRTGLLIALYRVKYQGWSVGAAHKEWEALGHSDLAQVFTHDLDEYYYKKARSFVRERKKKSAE